jgi:uncharacterized membrane protein YbhN (UPF0104 family)
MTIIWILSLIVFFAIVLMGTSAVFDNKNKTWLPTWVLSIVLCGVFWALSLVSLHLKDIAVINGDFKKSFSVVEKKIDGEVVSRKTNVSVSYFTNAGKR